MNSTAYRRARTKIRRPKFLSLRRQLAPPPTEMASADAAAADCQQLDLFPLHPEHLLLQDRDPPVACLLDDDNVGGGGPTLTALLGGAASTGDGSSPVSSSPVWDGDGDGLARRALRGRERWVYCRSSVASSSEEEVASTGTGTGVDLWWGALQALSLKLDYEEVLTAWSDRGSLYIDGDGPQVVPELYHTPSPVFVEVGSSGWRVPESDRTEGNEAVNREARVMRYREKRRSRLFSKRIRYEVRKLNAEKRPRWKGRFVKRKEEE